MKTTIQNLAVLILLISTMNVYSQEYGSHGIREDSSRPIAGLTIQEIRNAVYGVPAYQEGKTVLSVSNIPVMRDSMEMKKIATTPMLYIDSLIYEHILDAPLLDFQELLLKRYATYETNRKNYENYGFSSIKEARHYYRRILAYIEERLR